MPNWTYNTLTITGEKQELDKFRNEARAGKRSLSFDKFFPMPKELRGTTPGCEKNEQLIKKFGADNWHDWSKQNWGVKWDTRRPKIVVNKKNELVYVFDTPWNPPIKWMENVSKKFPMLKFLLECTEEMGNFVGNATAINGKVEEDFDQMNVGEYYEVIKLDNNNPLIVKFIDKGLSIILNTPNTKEPEKMGYVDSEDVRQYLFKVEHNGKVKMLELAYEFIHMINDIRVQGKTYVLIKSIVENREFLGMRELETLEDFTETFRPWMHSQYKDPKGSKLIPGGGF